MSWRARRPRVSVLADMALRQEKVMATLVALREKHSLSQEEAARRIGIGGRQYQRWESGQSMPRPANLGRAALAYGESVTVFYDEDEEPSTTQLDRLEAKVDRLLEASTRWDAEELREAIRRTQMQVETLAMEAQQRREAGARARRRRTQPAPQS